MIIYLAGAETSIKNYKFDPHPYTNLFFTYFYPRQCEWSFKRLKEIGHRGLITVDSGAHSFFNYLGNSATASHGVTNLKEMPDPYEYFEKYIHWAKEHEQYFDYFVELDLHAIVGYKTVKEWRKKISDIGLGHKLITVHRQYNSWEDFIDLIENSESKYIGMEGVKQQTIKLDYKKLIKECYDRQVRVHGFAMIKAPLIKEIPFATVDSSTWTYAIRTGSSHLYDPKAIDLVTLNKKEHFIKWKAPLDIYRTFRTMEDCKRKLKWEEEQYVKLETGITQHWEARGIFWKPLK